MENRKIEKVRKVGGRFLYKAKQTIAVWIISKSTYAYENTKATDILNLESSNGKVVYDHSFGFYEWLLPRIAL